MVRHRWIRWLAIASCSIAAGFGVQSKVAALDEARAEWDGGVEVLVLRHDIPAGDEISPGDVERRFISPDLVPLAAVAELTEPVVARHSLGSGEILVTTHVGDRSGPAGLLGSGTVGVSIPVQDGLAPALAVGDRVGVVIGPDPLGVSTATTPDGAGPTATVISVTTNAILIAVEDKHTVGVATAAASGRVTLVLLGTGKNPVRSPE